MGQEKQWEVYEKKLQGLTKRRKQKLKVMFNLICRGITKPIDELTREDIENFLDKVNKNEFTKLNGEPLSGSTKADIKKFLKQYFKLIKGNKEFYPKEVSWISTKIPKDEKAKQKPVITQDQAIKLASNFNKIEYRILTLILFDSGFRISELLSATKKDLTWDTFDNTGNKCFWIKCNESKTELRTIPISLFTDDIRSFYRSSYYKNLKDHELLFNVSYESYIKMLRRASKAVFGFTLTPHALRHSSATLYADLLNGDLIQLANRYGWSYSSSELTDYVRRSKATHKKTAKQVFNNDLLKLKDQMEEMQQQHKKEMKEVKEILMKQSKLLIKLKLIKEGKEFIKR